jgi:hypothetical protein
LDYSELIRKVEVLDFYFPCGKASFVVLIIKVDHPRAPKKDAVARATERRGDGYIIVTQVDRRAHGDNNVRVPQRSEHLRIGLLHAELDQASQDHPLAASRHGVVFLLLFRLLSQRSLLQVDVKAPALDLAPVDRALPPLLPLD